MFAHSIGISITHSHTHTHTRVHTCTTEESMLADLEMTTQRVPELFRRFEADVLPLLAHDDKETRDLAYTIVLHFIRFSPAYVPS